MESIAPYFQNAAALPVMPELLTRLLRSLSRDDLMLSELANLIGRDQSLSVKVLRLANSASFGPRQAVGSLRDASMLIGLRGMRDLALAASMSGMFSSQVKFDRKAFWRHSVATAGHARTVANVCGLDADVAYLGGLVLRIGRVLMLGVHPEAVAATEAEAVEPDTLMACERARLGCTHAQVSAGLAERWHFPEELILALGAAQAPLSTEPFSALGGVLRLASTLADAGERRLPELPTLQALHAPLLARLGIDETALGDALLPFDALTISVDQLLG
jgi:HD-like signal output (HDOD) protein